MCLETRREWQNIQLCCFLLLAMIFLLTAVTADARASPAVTTARGFTAGGDFPAHRKSQSHNCMAFYWKMKQNGTVPGFVWQCPEIPPPVGDRIGFAQLTLPSCMPIALSPPRCKARTTAPAHGVTLRGAASDRGAQAAAQAPS